MFYRTMSISFSSEQIKIQYISVQKVLNEKKDSRPLQFSRKNIIRSGHYQRTNVKTTKKLTK